MKKTALAVIGVLILLALMYLASRSFKTTDTAPIDEEERVDTLERLSQGTVAEPIAERQAVLRSLEASSTESAVPSLDERIKLLESLQKGGQ